MSCFLLHRPLAVSYTHLDVYKRQEDVEEFGIVLAEGSRGGEDFHDGAPCRERCAAGQAFLARRMPGGKGTGQAGEDPFMPLRMRCAGRAVFARAAGACVLNLAQQADLSTPDAVAGRCPFSFALRAAAVYNARKNATQVTMSILQDNTSALSLIHILAGLGCLVRALG